MEGTIQGLLERYEHLVLLNQELQKGWAETLQLLRELKSRNMALERIVVSDTGWKVLPLPQSPNGKVAEGELAKGS